MAYIRRTDGQQAAHAAGHRQLRNVVREEDSGLLVAEVGRPLAGDEVIDEAQYAAAVAAMQAHNAALPPPPPPPPPPRSPGQVVVDDAAGGDASKRDAALDELIRRAATPGR